MVSQEPDNNNKPAKPLLSKELAIIVVLVLVGVGMLFQLTQPVVEGPRERVRIGVAMQPTDALVFIALENGYFAALGLDVVYKKYPSGKRALTEGLFKGDVDLVSASDVPVAMAGLNNKKFTILTTLFRADNVNRIIARKDRGIAVAEDLKGKTVGTQRASAVHFFLNEFLLDHGIVPGDVTSRFLKAEQLPQALANGTLDAFSMREPYISQARVLLGDNAIVFAAPGLYAQVEVLVGLPGFIRAHPQVIAKVMAGLVRAETFASKNPAKAIKLTARWLGVGEQQVADIWPQSQFQMGLDASLLSLLESEARWAIENDISTAAQVPSYVKYMPPGVQTGMQEPTTINE